MTEIHIKEHSSPIKTPKQLVVVVVLAFVVPITLIVMLSQLITSGGDAGKSSPGMSDEAIAKRIQPVGRVVVANLDAPRAEKSGKEVVAAVCAACHASGALNAPKIGDKTAWGKLIKAGLDPLTKSAIKGVRQMPPRGGSPELSDVEIARAVAYMANQAGANFKEPAPKPAPAAKDAPAAAQAAAAPAAPAAPAAKAAASEGKAVFEANCAACHGTGVAGAPKAGDKAAWAPRLKTGTEALYTSAIKGKNAMPPKGGNPSLPDADVKAAVDYLVGLIK